MSSSLQNLNFARRPATEADTKGLDELWSELSPDAKAAFAADLINAAVKPIPEADEDAPADG